MYAAEESNLDFPGRSRARFPLRQRRVPPEGLEPSSLRLKGGDPAIGRKGRGAGAPRLAASESNRAIPAYQAGPVERLGRGQRKVEVSSSQVSPCTGFQGPLPRRRRTFQGGERRTRISRGYPPPGFRPGSAAWPIHPRKAEGAVIETDDRSRASASNGARPLAGSPSLSTVPGTRTPTARFLRPAPLPIGLGRHGVTDRIRTGPESMASSRANR